MKVLQVSTTCSSGSVGRIEVDLYNTLKKNGHDCLIAYGRGIPPKNIKTIRIGSNWNIQKNGLKIRLADCEGFGSKEATKNFIEQIEIYNPDIIHLHCLHGYYINIEVLFNYLALIDKPIIWTQHDCWAFTGHCTYFDYIKCDKWKTECNNCPQTKEYPKSLLFDNSKNNYQIKKKLFTLPENMTIVTPSKWLATLIKQSFLSKYPTEIIHNGIDLQVFKPVKSNFKEIYQCEKKIIILGVANVWNARKGFSTFVELSKVLSKDFQIILVGLTQKQIKKLPKNIIGITHTKSVDELAEIYTAADIFLNPTREDNFPTTNMEALACGTPVITFNTGGSGESLDANCGAVIKKEDLIPTIYSITNYLKENCIKRAKSFDKTLMFQEYLKLYKKRLGK